MQDLSALHNWNNQ